MFIKGDIIASKRMNKSEFRVVKCVFSFINYFLDHKKELRRTLCILRKQINQIIEKSRTSKTRKCGSKLKQKIYFLSK